MFTDSNWQVITDAEVNNKGTTGMDEMDTQHDDTTHNTNDLTTTI